MSQGQLYHYVSSKDDILFLIHRHLQIDFFRHVKKMDLPGNEEDAIQVLERSLRHALPFIAAHAKLFRFIIGESKHLNEQHLKVVLQMDDRNIVQYWRRLLKMIKEEKGIDIDINFSANLITYLAVFIPLRGWNLKTYSMEEKQDIMVQFILATIGIT